MSVEENKALVRREQAELWNHTGNLDSAAEHFAPDRVEDAKQEAASVRRGFPDLESTIEDLIAERDKVVAHWRAQATHQGEYMGIPPSGNRVDFRGISIYRIEGGKIAESWSVSDLLGHSRGYSAECVERLYEKSSQADQPPQHVATHGSIYERFPART